jgi:hypothetical protein
MGAVRLPEESAVEASSFHELTELFKVGGEGTLSETRRVVSENGQAYLVLF